MRHEYTVYRLSSYIIILPWYCLQWDMNTRFIGVADKAHLWLNDLAATARVWWRGEADWRTDDSGDDRNVPSGCRSLPSNADENTLSVQPARYLTGEFTVWWLFGVISETFWRILLVTCSLFAMWHVWSCVMLWYCDEVFTCHFKFIYSKNDSNRLDIGATWIKPTVLNINNICNAFLIPCVKY